MQQAETRVMAFGSFCHMQHVGGRVAAWGFLEEGVMGLVGLLVILSLWSWTLVRTLTGEFIPVVAPG
jgi:hypothetical protein